MILKILNVLLENYINIIINYFAGNKIIMCFQCDKRLSVFFIKILWIRPQKLNPNNKTQLYINCQR